MWGYTFTLCRSVVAVMVDHSSCTDYREVGYNWSLNQNCGKVFGNDNVLKLNDKLHCFSNNAACFKQCKVLVNSTTKYTCHSNVKQW